MISGRMPTSRKTEKSSFLVSALPDASVPTFVSTARFWGEVPAFAGTSEWRGAPADLRPSALGVKLRSGGRIGLSMRKLKTSRVLPTRHTVPISLSHRVHSLTVTVTPFTPDTFTLVERWCQRKARDTTTPSCQKTHSLNLSARELSGSRTPAITKG